MTMPDLTRETIAEIRRLLRDEAEERARYDAVRFDDNCDNPNDYYGWWQMSRGRLTDEVLANLSALLAAAERGLGAGDGR